METVRKTKITQKIETDALTVTEETDVAPLESSPPQTPLSQPETPTEPEEQPKPDLFSEAPELYGNNPTAAEIESFKERELAWRRKLKGNMQ